MNFNRDYGVLITLRKYKEGGEYTAPLQYNGEGFQAVCSLWLERYRSVEKMLDNSLKRVGYPTNKSVYRKSKGYSKIIGWQVIIVDGKARKNSTMPPLKA